MSASPFTESMRDIEAAIGRYLSSHTQDHIAKVLGLDQSNVSRRQTDVLNGDRTYVEAFGWRLVLLAADSSDLMAALLAARTDARWGKTSPEDACNAGLLGALEAAQSGARALAATSEGGTKLTPREINTVVTAYSQAIDQLGGAIHRLLSTPR